MSKFKLIENTENRPLCFAENRPLCFVILAADEEMYRIKKERKAAKAAEKAAEAEKKKNGEN